MKHQKLLIIGAGIVLGSVLIAFPKWYASRDEWADDREKSAEKDARLSATWTAYVNAPWLKLSAMGDPFSRVMPTIVAAMTAEGLDPAEYRAKALRWPNEKICRITLQHVEEFRLDREGRSRDSLGDPCGKCRTVAYDLSAGSISPLLIVQ
jgi:hypothetical protein